MSTPLRKKLSVKATLILAGVELLLAVSAFTLAVVVLRSNVILPDLSVHAQESYTVSANANQQAQITEQVTESNVRTCRRLSTVASPLTDTCTQAQACVNAGAAGGASCTPLQARQANARIFPQTTAGREEYITFTMVATDVQDRDLRLAKLYQERQCSAWLAASGAQRNVICAAYNAVDAIIPATVAAGCNLKCQ